MHMRLSDYVHLAFKNTLNQRSRSLLAILAIVISTTSVTILLALVIGAKNFYYDQFKATGQLSQVAVNPQTGLDFAQSQHGVNCESCNKLTNDLAKKIKSIPHVTDIGRTLDLNMFETAAMGSNKQTVHGVQGYESNGVVQHTVIAGKDFDDTSVAGDIIIGQNYADQWGYKGKYQDIVGKQITLTTDSTYTGQGAQLPDPQAQFKQCQDGCEADQLTGKQKPTTLRVNVVGVEADQPNSIFVPLSWAENLIKNHRYEITKADQGAYTQAYTAWVNGGRHGAEPKPKFTLVADDQVAKSGYSTFLVKVDNKDNTDTVAVQIQKLGVGAASAQSYIQSQLQVFNIISFILAGIGSIALAVAAIGIVNTMVMAVLERTREIGVMRALGAKRSTVSRLFTLEASLLGFLGGTTGIIVGYGLILMANFFINDQLAQNAVASRNIISLPAWLILAVIVATTIVGMLAGLYPAHRAAKLDPVEALRHE